MAGYLGGRLQVNDKSHRPPGIIYPFPKILINFKHHLHFSICCPTTMERRSDRHKQVIRAKSRKPRQHCGYGWKQPDQEKTRGRRGRRRGKKELSRTPASLPPVEGNNLLPVNLQGTKSLATVYSCGLLCHQ